MREQSVLGLLIGIRGRVQLPTQKLHRAPSIQSSLIILIEAARAIKHEFLSLLQVFNPFLEIINQKLVLSLLILDETLADHRLVAVNQSEDNEEENNRYEDGREINNFEEPKRTTLRM
jgi:hypothetical protein